MNPKVAAFLQQVAGLAQRLGGVPVLIVVRDPGTRGVSFVGTPGALDNMRQEIAEKVGAGGEDLPGWESHV